MKAHRVCTGAKALSIGMIAWAYIFGGTFVANTGAAPSGLTSAITLQRPDEPVVETASGVVTVRKTATSQEVIVELRGLPAQEGIVGGLGVFLGSAPFDTNNFYFVNVLDGPGSNGNWHVDLKGTVSAPAQLGVADVTDLVDRYLQICDAASNVFLQTIIPPLVANPRALSYRRRVQFQQPDPAPSPSASGVLIIKFDGKRGASLVESRLKKLAGGNSYCSWIVAFTNAPTETCAAPAISLDGHARFKNDTRQGQQIGTGALNSGVVTVDQVIDYLVEIRDEFGVTHLRAVIPGPLP